MAGTVDRRALEVYAVGLGCGVFDDSARRPGDLRGHRRACACIDRRRPDCGSGVAGQSGESGESETDERDEYDPGAFHCFPYWSDRIAPSHTRWPPTHVNEPPEQVSVDPPTQVTSELLTAARRAVGSEEAAGHRRE